MNSVKRIALLLSSIVYLVSACSSTPDMSGRLPGVGVTVVGVTARSGLDVSFNRNLLAQEFAAMLAERGEFAVVPSSALRRAIGPTRLEQLLLRHARNVSPSAQDIQLLMGAGLPTTRAIMVRIEDDRTQKRALRREPVRNRAGALLLDRERHVLATQRITRMSATLIDLRTGELVWQRTYEVGPITEQATTQYLGSSFSGSLAAAFANAVVNGLRVASHPEAPPLRLNLRSLLREIALRAPVA
ncbi:MAG: hypothetical protein HKN42_03950 [Granulosicoccus sp.]|nr:hypothetical protein [Granulosicoccus sp.]